METPFPWLLEVSKEHMTDCMVRATVTFNRCLFLATKMSAAVDSLAPLLQAQGLVTSDIIYTRVSLALKYGVQTESHLSDVQALEPWLEHTRSISLP